MIEQDQDQEVKGQVELVRGIEQHTRAMYVPCNQHSFSDVHGRIKVFGSPRLDTNYEPDPLLPSHLALTPLSVWMCHLEFF